MEVEIIDGTKIEHKGDVNTGLTYLKNHWNDKYVLDIFENAKTSSDKDGEFRIDGQRGTYVLKYIEEHHFRLEWRDY